jgi:uncharacterized protein (DUF849 family)
MQDHIWDYDDPYQWMERATKFPPLIITVAVNGGIQGKESHTALPELPDEIAAQAQEGYEAGASIIHIHGRDPGNFTNCTEDPEVYREILGKVREKCPDLILNITTGGGPTTTDEGRIASLDSGPEMASLNLGPDMERFTLAARKPPLPWNVMAMLRELPPDSMFTVAGIGKYQWSLAATSIILGGNVRVGLEDNLYLNRGQKLKGNGEAVQKVVRLANEFGRAVATPAQAREMLGLSATPSTY